MVAVRRDALENSGSGSRRDVAGNAWFVASLGFAVAALALRLSVESLDHGYTRYATIAWEMVRSGDWIAPHLDDRLYVDKPPLSIWLIALPMALAKTTASFAQHTPNLVALVLSVFFLRRLWCAAVRPRWRRLARGGPLRLDAAPVRVAARQTDRPALQRIPARSV